MTELPYKIDKIDEVRSKVQPRWDEARASRVLDGTKALAGRRRRRARAARALAVAALLLGAIGTFGWRALRPGDGGGPTPPTRAEVLRLRDGSCVTSLDAATRLRADEAPGVVTVELERGQARFDVARDPSRLFRVQAGSVSVEVIGTQFTVERGAAVDGEVVVRVERGRVRVRRPGDADRFLDAGGAVRLRQVTPGAPPEPVDPVGELLRTADASRAAGQPGEAIASLERVARDYPGDGRAPLASFTLGRVLLDDLDHPREAALAFGRSRALWPAGPLAPDALAREVEAWSRAGDRPRAHALGEEYLRRWPDGPRAAAVRRLGAAP